MSHDVVAPLTDAEIRALKALKSGTASEGQQTLGMNAVIKKLCGTNSLPYVPGSFDQTAFKAGRAFVATQIIKVMNMKMKEDDNG